MKKTYEVIHPTLRPLWWVVPFESTLIWCVEQYLWNKIIFLIYNLHFAASVIVNSVLSAFFYLCKQMWVDMLLVRYFRFPADPWSWQNLYIEARDIGTLSWVGKISFFFSYSCSLDLNLMSTSLNVYFSEWVLCWMSTSLNEYFTERVLHWMRSLMNEYFTEWVLHLTSTSLNEYFTERVLH